ncbi:TonB-dependent receptor [candidate division KSB1 bacterium]|nr:TonB-dependent receptor [candidate division KSB1 bacterium]
MYRILKLKIIILLLLIVTAQAKITGLVEGVVRSGDNNESLPGANVFIENTFIGASTDANGHFIISVPPGTYSLKASYIGYKAAAQPILVKQNRTITVNFNLEPTTLQSEQIIITGSRQPETLSSAASSINILGYNEIERRNNMRIDEALLSVPGVAIVGENINIRGGSGYNRLGGSRSLVLLDGVPILTSDLGAANWNILPVTEIEHIEVLKGAASSLYGSGAISGVINIFTKMPGSKPGLSVRQSSGIYDNPSVPEWKWTDKTLYYTRTDLSLTDTFGPVGLRLAVSHHRSTGDRENGFFERWYFTGKTHIQLPGQSTLSLFSTYSKEDRELFLQWMEQDRALNVPPTERGNSYAIDGYVGYAVFNKLFSPTLSTKIRVSYNQQLVGIPFNITGAFTPALGLSGEMQVNWKPHRDHSLSLGVDYKYDQVESKYYGKRRANGISPYLQEIWKFSELLQLNAGLRLDTYTLVGDSVEMQLSPKIGGSYQPWYGTIIHFSIGRGFRAATVVERFITAGSKDFKALPNPDLQPERSTLFDLGVRQNIGETAYAEATLFSSSYKNLIEPTLRSDLTALFLNYPKGRIRGIESELRWDLWRDHIRLQTSATWMDPRELESNEPLPYRPKFIAYFSPAFYYGAFTFEADYRYMSKLRKLAIYPLDEQVPTKVWDLRWSYNWSSFKFQFMIKNALNYNYTVSERVLGEIRNYGFSVSSNF